MRRDEKEALKADIKKELNRLEKEMLDLETILEPIAPDCCLGDVTRFEMMHEQELSYQALELARARYTKLKNQLHHIEDAHFGLCIACDEPIAYKRLKLLPEARLCIDCAKEKQ